MSYYWYVCVCLRKGICVCVCIRVCFCVCVGILYRHIGQIRFMLSNCKQIRKSVINMIRNSSKTEIWEEVKDLQIYSVLNRCMSNACTFIPYSDHLHVQYIQLSEHNVYIDAQWVNIERIFAIASLTCKIFCRWNRYSYRIEFCGWERRCSLLCNK